MSSVTPQQSDGNQPQPHLVISAHNGINRRAAYLSDGRVVASSDSRTAKVWNVENGEQEGTSMEHEGKLCSLAVVWDGTKLVTGGVTGNITVWNVESQEIVEKWTHPQSWPEIAVSPDDRPVAVGNLAVAIYTMEGRQVNGSIWVGDTGQSMCFSPNGKKFACAAGEDVRVYGVVSGTLILGPLRGHQDPVCWVLWSRDGSRLFSCSSDETIRCWNTDTGEQIGHPWTGHANNIHSLSLSPDGSILASASRDHTVGFWDVTTGQPIGRHLQHDKRVKDVRFSPSGEFVVSAGGDGNIYLWRVPWMNSVEARVRTLHQTHLSIHTHRFLSPSNRQALPPISTRRATACTLRKRPTCIHLRHTPRTSAWISILV